MQQIRGGWRSRLDPILVTGLAILVFISGVYAIPYSAIPADWIVYAKRTYYLGLIGLLILATSGQGVTGISLFSLYCGLFVLFFMGNAVIRQDMFDEYVYCLLSITFIWLFVRYVISANFPVKRFMDLLGMGLLVFNLCALYVLVACVSGDQEIQNLIASGFDGCRVNFSIWLGQIVFLNFFLAGRQRGGFTLAVVASSVILAIQVFSGGRTGVLFTLAVVTYFIVHRPDGVRVKAAMAGYVLALIWVCSQYSPVTKVGEEISVFRHLMPTTQATFASSLQHVGEEAPIERLWIEEAVEHADRVSGHRLRIMLNALERLDAKAMIIGNGMGHFDVVADNNTWMVHNVFLKILGELGIGALLLLLLLVWLPFTIKNRNRHGKNGLHYLWAIGLVVGMLQPRFIVTGLSNCLIMWLCYALILKSPCSMRSKRKEDGLEGYAALTVLR